MNSLINRKILIVSILFLFIISVSAVSANENLTDISDSSDGEIAAGDEILKISNDLDDETIGDDDDASTFEDLTREIDEIEDGGVINLTRDYRYDSGSKEGILINKSITINGNNHRIDGNGQSRIFNANNGNVTLNDMVLVNGNHENGGAVYVNSSLVCNNVAFENNRACEGGAIYVMGSISVNDCVFDGNDAEKGAAIYIGYTYIAPPSDDDYNDTDDSNDTEDYNDD